MGSLWTGKPTKRRRQPKRCRLRQQGPDVNRIRSVSSNTEGEVKDATGSLAENTKGRIGGKVEQVAGQVRGAHPSSKRATREGPSIMGAELNDFMAARPVTALFIAVGVGYMLARLMRH